MGDEFEKWKQLASSLTTRSASQDIPGGLTRDCPHSLPRSPQLVIQLREAEGMAQSTYPTPIEPSYECCPPIALTRGAARIVPLLCVSLRSPVYNSPTYCVEPMLTAPPRERQYHFEYWVVLKHAVGISGSIGRKREARVGPGLDITVISIVS